MQWIVEAIDKTHAELNGFVQRFQPVIRNASAGWSDADDQNIGTGLCGLIDILKYGIVKRE